MQLAAGCSAKALFASAAMSPAQPLKKLAIDVIAGASGEGRVWLFIERWLNIERLIGMWTRRYWLLAERVVVSAAAAA